MAVGIVQRETLRMKLRRRLAAALLAVLGPMLAAGPAAADFRDIEGTATYGEQSALPREAVLEVQLLALPSGGPLVSEGEGAPSAPAPTPIASVSVRVLGAKPYPFRLAYDEAIIERGRRYALAARITLGDETVFESAQATPVLTGITDDPPQLMLVRPAPEHPVQPGLENTTWTVTEMAAGDLAPQARAEVEFMVDGAARGSGGCNAFESSYRVEPPQGLSFGEVASTLRGCSAGIQQQDRLVFRALGETRSYEISDRGELLLFDAEGAMLLRLRRKR